MRPAMSDTGLFKHQLPGNEFPPGNGALDGGPACPLTGSQHIQVLEEFSTALLVDCYWRDLGVNVAPHFRGIEKLQLCRCLDSHVIFFYPAAPGSSAFYETLQTFNWYYPTNRFEYQRAATWIKTGDRVLDIGCGAAHFANYIPDTSYHGLDPIMLSRETTSYTERRMLPERVTWEPMTFSQTFDVVCAFQVLEHMADPLTFLSEAIACLKPSGLFILSVPCAESYITGIPNFALNAPPHHLTWWTKAALIQLADQFQLSILEVTHAPVESWERRLFWMQQILGAYSLQGSSYFTESRLCRFFQMIAYIIAGYLETRISPPIEAQGASVVMVGRKIKSSMCNL